MDRHMKDSLDHWLTTPPEERDSLTDSGDSAVSAFQSFMAASNTWPTPWGREVLRIAFMAGWTACEHWAGLYEQSDEEEPIEEYDPGPEVDDQGGMSERYTE